jgi:Xaa-Pro aminopeptidase
MTSSERRRRREPAEFTRREFEQRVERARALMVRERLDGILVTSEMNLEYLSGFTTQFAWNTPTRPWYFVLPLKGRAVAVIPEIGLTNWQATSWCRTVLTWPSPRPENEGLDLLAKAILAIPRRFGRFGVELGPESRLGMPVADLLRLKAMIRPFALADAIAVMRPLRLIKSPAEVARIRHICRIAGDAFDRLPGLVADGDTERDVVRKFQAELYLLGADKTPYTAIGSGRGGYDSIIQGPLPRRLRRGDIFLIDTGSRWGGYFCDFDRNVALGKPTDKAKRMHELLWRATEAGIAAARPGRTAADVFYAQARVLEDAGIALGNVGRFGHGLGKNMTEPPSNKPGDATVLAPGVVLTVEPSAMYDGNKIMVHEENLVVTEDKPVLLTRRAPREMPVVAL